MGWLNQIQNDLMHIDQNVYLYKIIRATSDRSIWRGCASEMGDWHDMERAGAENIGRNAAHVEENLSCKRIRAAPRQESKRAVPDFGIFRRTYKFATFTQTRGRSSNVVLLGNWLGVHLPRIDSVRHDISGLYSALKS